MTQQRHPDQPAAWANQTDLLIGCFQRYRAALDSLPDESHRPLLVKPSFHRHLTFLTLLEGWGTVAETHLAFKLTNEINNFGQALQKLTAWESVLNSAEVNEKHELLIEFVIPLAIHVLNLPFALKNRFAFASMRLSDEVNQFGNSHPVHLERTSDEMKTPEWKLMWRYGAHWHACAGAKESVEKIVPNGSRRVGNIHAYRDRFVHRIPDYIGLGSLEKTSVERSERGWKVTTSNLPPLNLQDIVRDLIPAHEACIQAHAALCKLAEEHWQHLHPLLNSRRAPVI